MDDLKRSVGRRIKLLRVQMGWSQPELAHRASTTSQTISGIECGNTATNLDLLERLARALEVDASELLTAGPPPPRAPDPLERILATLRGQPQVKRDLIERLMEKIVQEVLRADRPGHRRKT